MDVPRQKSLEEAVRLNSTERDYLSGPHIEQRQRNLEKKPKKTAVNISTAKSHYLLGMQTRTDI